MKQIQLTLEQAREIFKEGNEVMNKMLLANFNEGELRYKREFSDIDHMGFIGTGDGGIYKSSLESDSNRNCIGDWPTKGMAKASLALSQLAWWMRQPEYNGEDQDEWCDWGDSTQDKHCIAYFLNAICHDVWNRTQKFLAFKTEEIRDRFLEDRRELIEQAKPLL